MWRIPDGKSRRIYNYSDIVSFELLEDGENITKGGICMAVAGGVLFGNAGAIVGGAAGKNKKRYAIFFKLKPP